MLNINIDLPNKDNVILSSEQVMDCALNDEIIEIEKEVK